MDPYRHLPYNPRKRGVGNRDVGNLRYGLKNDVKRNNRALTVAVKMAKIKNF